MTELELYSKQTQEQGGLWACLERCDKCSLYKTMDMKQGVREMINGVQVFQVFDHKGKRKCATTNLNVAYTVYNDLKNNNEI